MTVEHRFIETFVCTDQAQTQEQNRELEGPNVELDVLKSQLQCADSLGGLIGISSRMQAIHDLIRKAANHTFPVLILGETGVGKELAARCIHNLSSRKHSPFVAVDCSSLAPTLIESELFGHVRGAFTGADSSKKGLIETANEGTLFLDEIGELPKALQSKLLRVLQEREIRPVGSAESRPTTARFIAATNRDLKRAVEEGAFRADLYYRLNVFPIQMPTLRERRGDIPLLVTAFLAKHADPARPINNICQDLWNAVMSCDWPGNVRELENFVARCIALGSGSTLRDEVGCLNFEQATDDSLKEKSTQRLDAMERCTIIKVLKENSGDKITAARILGIGKTTIYRKLKQYGVDAI